MRKITFRKKYGPWGLITGASDGIGRAMAEEAAREGLNIVIVARRGARLQSLADELTRKFGVEIHVVIADLATNDGVRAVLRQTVHREIGLLVHCAGFGTSGNFVDASVTDELEMIDVNCRAVAAITHPIVNRMRIRGHGGIIMMSSIVAFQGVARAANYSATKAYIQTFAEGLQTELKGAGIDVLSSAPGPVNSGFAARANMRMGQVAKPVTIARDTFASLGRKGTVRPGGLSKLLGYSLAVLPRFIRSAIMSRIMRGMT